MTVKSEGEIEDFYLIAFVKTELLKFLLLDFPEYQTACNSAPWADS